MIKDVSFGAYVIPVKIKENKAEVALLEYAPGAYGAIGGRFDDGESACDALKRELCEELGESATLLSDAAIQISSPYSFHVAPHKIEERGARNEKHIFFVAHIPADVALTFCEQCTPGVRVVWMDYNALLDDKIIAFADQRRYFEQYVMPVIQDTKIASEMLHIATDFMRERYGMAAAVVAVLRTIDGQYLTSVCPDVNNAAVELCAETGAICEAHKLNKTVTYSLCIGRASDGDAWRILTPCGVCQERLFWWGGDVKCAVTNPENKVLFKTLSEIQPHYWRK